MKLQISSQARHYIAEWNDIGLPFTMTARSAAVESRNEDVLYNLTSVFSSDSILASDRVGPCAAPCTVSDMEALELLVLLCGTVLFIYLPVVTSVSYLILIFTVVFLIKTSQGNDTKTDRSKNCKEKVFCFR